MKKAGLPHLVNSDANSGRLEIPIPVPSVYDAGRSDGCIRPLYGGNRMVRSKSFLRGLLRFLLVLIAVYGWFGGIVISLGCLVNGTSALLAAGILHLLVALLVTVLLRATKV